MGPALSSTTCFRLEARRSLFFTRRRPHSFIIPKTAVWWCAPPSGKACRGRCESRGARGQPRARETIMTSCGASASHDYFQIRLPASSDAIHYAFRLDDGALVARDDGATFTAKGLEIDDTPAWWADAVVYTVFVDRFRPSRDYDGWAVDPGAGKWAGGDLAGIRRSLDYLADLGVNTLYLTPIHVAASCHRYDLEDPRAVDPALGGEQALASCSRTCTRAACGSFSIGRSATPAPDLRLIAMSSPRDDSRATRAGFSGRPPGSGTALRRGDGGADRVAHYGGCVSAPLLDLKNGELAAYALACAEHWVRRGVDGLRIDCAAQVPMPLLVELRARVRETTRKPSSSASSCPSTVGAGALHGALDASTDFGFYRLGLHRFATPGGDQCRPRRAVGAPFVRAGARTFDIRPEVHIDARFSAVFQSDAGRRVRGKRRARADLAAHHARRSDAPLRRRDRNARRRGGDRSRRCMARSRALSMGSARSPSRGESLRGWVRDLLRVRASSVAPYAAARWMRCTPRDRSGSIGERPAFDVVDIAIHQGQNTLVVELDDDELPFLTVLFQGRQRHRGRPSCDVRSDRARSCCAGAPPCLSSRRRARARRQPRRLRRARDDAFRSGRRRALYPRRLDVSLTERCNLKCAHCITLAPERTAQGTARTMTPFVLSRLRPRSAMPSTSDSCTAARRSRAHCFFDFLRILEKRAAPSRPWSTCSPMGCSSREPRPNGSRGRGFDRSRCPSTAHARDERWRSLGRSLGTIMKHLEEAVRARRRGELRSASRAVDCGLAEQSGRARRQSSISRPISGSTGSNSKSSLLRRPYARTSLLRLDGARMAAAVGAACAHAAARGILALDHTVPMPRWVCTLDSSAEERARHRADEFINRTVQNPCRDAWELACIEPNGDVMVGAFHGVLAGNLAENEMLEVWNSEAAGASDSARGLSEGAWEAR